MLQSIERYNFQVKSETADMSSKRLVMSELMTLFERERERED